MLGKLHTFSQFILERADRNVGGYYLNKLRSLNDQEVINKLEALNRALNGLEADYWYDREGGRSHYALNMKIHAWPDLDKWAQIKGIEDEDDKNEDAMYNDWYRFMEDTYEMNSEDYVESFPWIKMVGVGGRSGGWLLIYPDATHDAIEDDLSYHLEDYLNNVPEGFDLETIKDYAENPESQELAGLGLLDTEGLEEAESAMESRKELLEWIDSKLAELGEVSRDLAKIEGEIRDFKNRAEELFYEWLTY